MTSPEETLMHIAMIGLGKIGANLAQRLMKGGQAVKKAD
jgi:6-phosphogluconate dehydrogenase (decarboxylating)